MERFLSKMKSYNLILDNFLSNVVNTLEPDRIYDAMMDTFQELLDPAGLLLILNRQTSHTYYVTRSFGTISYEKDYTAPSDAILSYLHTTTGIISITPDCREMALITPKKREWLLSQHISIIVPLRYQHAIIGFLFVVPKENMTYTSDDLFFLEKFCFYGAIALRNANLYQNAYHASIMDDLTPLYNRKHALSYISETCCSDDPYTLILLDVDNFKLYNELYGAKEGDQLIRLCAKIILQEIDEADIAFRYGADEFFILCHGNDTDAAAVLSRRIIQKISSENPADTVWDISISCGISTYPDLSADAAALMHDTVQAAYFGKLGGKGSLTVYRHGIESRMGNLSARSAYERVAPTIYALTAAIDAKDNYTFVHSMNVAKYAVFLAEALDLDENSIEIVREAALLHDIGKISIPEHILKKHSNLTPEEYEIMKTHVENSTKMIRYLPDMDYVIPAVLGHHERYDGGGYPRGLSGEEIPYLARILSIADCFDAITARRTYKQPFPISYALEELQKNAGTQFDPAMVETFVSLVKDGIISL